MATAPGTILQDNAYGTIGAGLTAAATTVNLTTGHGVRFPTVVAGQVLIATLVNNSNVVEEIEITAHTASADSMTVVRGANGTTAKVWSSNDRIECRVTSEVLRRLQQEAIAEIVLTTADAGITYTATPSPAQFELVPGVIYPLKLSTTNSVVAPTVAISGLSAVTVVTDSSGALGIGQMPLHGLYKFDGTNLILMTGTANITGLTEDTAPDINADFVMTYDTSAAANKKVKGYRVGGGNTIHLRDSKASGTDGGTFTAPGWQTRTLNTEAQDTGSNCALAANQFTLDAGTYDIFARSPAFQVGKHQAKLRNVTDGSDILIGASSFSGATQSTQTDSIVTGRFTIAAGKALELQHQGTGTQTTTGFGNACNFSVTEIYAEVWLKKVA